MMNQRKSKGQVSLSPDLPKTITWSYKLKKQDKAKAKGKIWSRLPKGPPPGRPWSNEEMLAFERDGKAFKYASENERVLEKHHKAQKLELGCSPIALTAQASRLLVICKGRDIERASFQSQGGVCSKQSASRDPPGKNLSSCQLKQELASTGSQESFIAGSSHLGSNDELTINTLTDESDTSDDDSSNKMPLGDESYSNGLDCESSYGIKNGSKTDANVSYSDDNVGDGCSNEYDDKEDDNAYDCGYDDDYNDEYDDGYDDENDDGDNDESYD